LAVVRSTTLDTNVTDDGEPGMPRSLKITLLVGGVLLVVFLIVHVAMGGIRH